ncbi:hypothetical protein SLA2020_505460 [Shorea laevis]
MELFPVQFFVMAVSALALAIVLPSFGAESPAPAPAPAPTTTSDGILPSLLSSCHNLHSFSCEIRKENDSKLLNFG